MPLQIGDQVSHRYRVLQPLGQGGMARVFLVEDEPTAQRLVLKELRAPHAELLAAFRAEFALLAGLTHPRLTRVHDFGATQLRGQWLHYYTAAWIDGTTLREHARREPERWLQPLADALEGLLALHDLGVVHGDFTPDNVLVEERGGGVLIDLGCARPRGQSSESLAGTPGFLAPELLGSGSADVASDLYAVGASLKQLQQLAGGPARRELSELISRLLADDPQQRPNSVRSVLAALGQHAAAGRSPAARSLRLVGREAERTQFGAWLQALLAGQRRPRALAVQGRRGSGKSRLLRELAASAELRLPVLRAHAREAGAVAWLLDAATGTSEPRRGARGAVAAAEALARRGEPCLLVLEDEELASPSDREWMAQFVRSLDERASVGLVVSGVEPLPGLAPELVERLELQALDAAALGEWTQHAFSERRLEELAQHSEGLPARIEVALSQWSGASTPSPGERTDPRWITQATADLSEPELGQLALVLALDGGLEPHDFGLDSTHFGFGFERQLLQRERSTIALSSLVDRAELERAVGPVLLQRRHREVAALLVSDSLKCASPVVREAEILRHLMLGDRAQDAALRLASAEPLWRREPAPFLQRVARLDSRELPAPARLTLLELALLGNEPRLALRLAACLLRRRPPRETAQQARVAGAEALTRLGRGARAARLLERLLSADPAAELQPRLLTALARARIGRGDYAGAEQAARTALALGTAEQQTTALQEALGVAALYAGRSAEAEAHFAEAIARGAQLTPRDHCRLLGYRAICAFRAGRPSLARDDQAQALLLAERAGLDDLLGTCHLNLGTTLQQAGELGEALEQYQRGLAVARALGRESTELGLRYNAINLQVELGDFESVQTDLEALGQRAAKAQLRHFAPALALIRSEIALTRGELESAERALGSAAQGFTELSLERERLEVELGYAELALARGDLAAALARTERVHEQARALDATDLVLRAEIARVRIGSRQRAPAVLEPGQAAFELAERSGQYLLAARLATELCLAAEACGAPRLVERFDAARKLWDRLAAQLPEPMKRTFWADPRRAGLLRFTRAAPASGLARAQDAAALRRLLSLSRRINSSLSLERVLEYAVEAAVDLCGAERGFLLLRDAQGSVQLCTRFGAEPSSRPSSNIVERVLASGEALLTTDAESDARFTGFGSVHAQRLKAVLCVPVATPSEQLGALYVDSRLARTRLSEAARDLLSALADHLAVALGNARLHAALEQRSRELETEKRTVERLSQGKDRELERLREQIEAQRRTLEFRYDYKQIAGRGERMSRVLRELDRIIDSDVSVLIQGESGTGKELIARAIHVHGARKDAPFVAVNCASIPETLLESELFGHTKGAFTGADRDKTGLLLSANGGTLFLDELAELSLATQAKLLRVLQEREVRPLGAERARAFDVRLVCATHRKLAREVEAARFREDLFYRVAVVEIELPALRDRIEDLPEISRAILTRLARSSGRAPPELGPDALRALATYPFPGNVRELENILTRAVVLSGRERLGAADLDLARSPARSRHSRTRGEFEAEERERILQALRGARWNVSVVSRSLGIPRNTLYRKLERYGLTRESSWPAPGSHQG